MNQNTFRRENLRHIRDIFQKKTGVCLPARKTAGHSARYAAILAVVLVCCLTTTAFAFRLFSPLDGDELRLQAVYEGNGVVSITVGNGSDKDLEFQEVLKLMRWSTSAEVEPLSDRIVFSSVRIPAHSTGTMTVDLSGAYDMALLEEPLGANDWYYLVLTNQDFIFGQDWMCSVEFAGPARTPLAEEPAPVQTGSLIAPEVIESLRFYFETIAFDPEERRAMDADYMAAVEEVFRQFDGNIVPSVSPWLLIGDPSPSAVFDSSVPQEEQYLLVGEHRLKTDGNFKLLATAEESALVLSASVPLEGAADIDVPFFYVFTYDKEAAASGGYAFIYGQIRSFAAMEPLKIYEDEQYVCYEASPLICPDLRQFVRQSLDVQLDSSAWERLENIVQYYQENAGSLFYYP